MAGKYILRLFRGESDTLLLGAKFAAVCVQRCVIYLSGHIGVGKSVFCKGFLNELGYTGYVKSPTYTLMTLYTVMCWKVYHFDFYRVRSFREIEDMGMRDYFDDERAIFLMEWPKKGVGLPKEDILVTIDYDSLDLRSRKVTIQSCSKYGQTMLDAIFSVDWNLCV